MEISNSAITGLIYRATHLCMTNQVKTLDQLFDVLIADGYLTEAQLTPTVRDTVRGVWELVRFQS